MAAGTPPWLPCSLTPANVGSASQPASCSHGAPPAGKGVEARGAQTGPVSPKRVRAGATRGQFSCPRAPLTPAILASAQPCPLGTQEPIREGPAPMGTLLAWPSDAQTHAGGQTADQEQSSQAEAP